MKRIIKCEICGELKENHAKGMCNHCYTKERNKKHKAEIRLQRQKHYQDNSEDLRLKSQTYRENKSNYGGGTKNNVNCATYLGIHIGERVLSHVFKNVILMPKNNKGYDFICGNGYKIDVKSSCKHISKTRSNYWTFQIYHNIIADYFLCIAFNNRENLEPEHLWLIPIEDVYNMSGISISESTILKWKKYEQSLDKVITCCDSIRFDNKEKLR